MSSRDKSWKRSHKRLSGYQFFLRAVLDEMKTRYPDSSIVLSEVSKLCAENWQALHEVVKKRFQEEAEAINQANVALRGDKSKSRVLAPKRPLSAFILFCKDNREDIKKANPGLSMGEISSVLSIMWSLSEKEAKLDYQRVSRKQRERYRAELKASKEAAASSAKDADTVPPPVSMEVVDAKEEDDDGIPKDVLN